MSERQIDQVTILLSRGDPIVIPRGHVMHCSLVVVTPDESRRRRPAWREPPPHSV